MDKEWKSSSRFLSSITDMLWHNLWGHCYLCDLLSLSTTSFADTDDFDIIPHCQPQRGRERQKGGVTVRSPLTDNVMIRGICSLFVSELPLCSSDPYDTSSGSLQLISIKPMVAQPNYSHPASSDRSQDSAVVNGEVMHIPQIFERPWKSIFSLFYAKVRTSNMRNFLTIFLFFSLG